MKFELVRPCKRCPFRTDVPNYLTFERREDIAEAITTYQQTFSCHQTIDYDVESDEYDGDNEGDGVQTKDTQHCAGALILLEKLNQQNQLMRIAERLGFYNYKKLDMNTPVFNDIEDFINHE